MTDGTIAGKIGQDFRVRERIRMARTTDPALDGCGGTILGKAFSDPHVSFYIVGLDQPHPETGFEAIMLIESCIDRISNHH